MRSYVRWVVVLAVSFGTACGAGSLQATREVWPPLAVLTLTGWLIQRRLMLNRLATLALLGEQALRATVATVWIVWGPFRSVETDLYVKSGLSGFLVLMLGEVWEMASRGWKLQGVTGKHG